MTCPNCGGEYEPLDDPWVHVETGTRKCPKAMQNARRPEDG